MSYTEVEDARNYLLDRIGGSPDAAVILGSGMSAVDQILRNTTRIDYSAVPYFPLPTVEGHRRELVFGNAGSARVLIFTGRVHYYEGARMDQVTRVARIVGRLGVKALLITNAAGAINTSFSRGQLMLIADHINMLGVNPLSGPNEERWGPRFVEQSSVYNPALRNRLQEAARSAGINLLEGVYAAVPGPTYETPAEIRLLRTIGADAVGMSTVPEAVVAHHMGVKTAGISLLTDASASSEAPPNHEEVLAMAERMSGDLARLLTRFFENWK